MNILILGSSGLLGRQLCNFLKSYKKINLIDNGLRSRKFNINNKSELKKLIFISNPYLIINASGFTNIDLCERKKKYSRRLNVGVIKNIFKLKKKYRLKFFFIQFSTDQIYDSKKIIPNKENFKLKINNEYSRQKVAQEKLCLKNKSLILRTNFFGKTYAKKQSFSDWVYRSFNRNKKFYLFKDVYFNPLRIDTICKIIKNIIIKNNFKIRGIYNIGSRGYMSKSNFAIYFAKKIKIYKKNYFIKNVNSVSKVKRSKNMIMDIKKFEYKFNIRLPKIKNEITNEIKKYANAKI
jgi:dTDP-4-dehydrorhamnose reductase